MFYDLTLNEPSIDGWQSYVAVTVGGQFVYECFMGRGFEYANKVLIGNWADISDKCLGTAIYHLLRIDGAYNLTKEQCYRLDAITIQFDIVDGKLVFY